MASKCTVWWEIFEGPISVVDKLLCTKIRLQNKNEYGIAPECIRLEVLCTLTLLSINHRTGALYACTIVIVWHHITSQLCCLCDGNASGEYHCTICGS